MATNHRNRSWRAQWQIGFGGNNATHKSGLFAIRPYIEHRNGSELLFQNAVDMKRWDIKKLKEQAYKLLIEKDS